MAEKKSILEEALLDINNIQNALNANTKEILRSVAKEEIDSVVKESLKEEVYEEEDVDNVEVADVASDDMGDIDSSEEMTDGLGDEGLEVSGEIGMGDESPEEIDMTGASDDDVIAIYKKLSGDDEIEIVGDELRLNVTEPGEYVVKLDSLKGGEEEMGSEELELDSTEDSLELDAVEDEESDEVEYDIEMGDDNEEEASEETEEEESEEGEESEEEAGEESEEEAGEESEEEIEEAQKQGGKVKYVGGSRTNEKLKDDQFIHEAAKAKQIVSETTKKYNSLLTEAKKLKAENDEFRTALKEFRTKLVETVVFNSNLTYVTKLFMEHSTTKAEKQSIIKRFDEEVSNLKESKRLYKTIANELEHRKPIAESVENKIIKEGATSVSKQLNENTAYVDPSTKRIMDLINRVEKRK